MKQSAKDEPRPQATKSKSSWQSIVVIVIACGLLAYSGHGFWQRYQATHRPNPLTGQQATVTHSTDKPDETPIKSDEQYDVPAAQPRRIILPSIDTEAFVQRVGLDQHGAVAVPSNINLAGWFVANETPGQAGLSIIDGHVQGRYAPGAFRNLSKVAPGDRFTIEFGDRHTVTFEIVSVTSYETEAVKAHLFTKRSDIQSQLNLITCDGPFDKATQQYTKRLLVVSKALGS